ncbi:sensor histidine kinase [Anatilimnocola aggregata]|uniref:sensor histidine kinase n=1 Tax=Anatilimnocola aggregata TaxID=2528021 RepID=UPI0011A4245E|nr:ATP-binding protein [Anatilimnocola aggregata]
MHFNTWFWRLFALQALVCAGFAIVTLIMVSSLEQTANPGSWSLIGGLAIAALIAVAASALATWFSWKQVQRPIIELAQLARQLSGGDEQNLPPAQPGDELVEISGALQRIRGRLDLGKGQAQQNTERLQAVLASMIEGVLAVGPDKSILLANQAGRRLLDFTTQQPHGRPLLEVTRARAVHEAVEQVLETLAPVEREFDSPGLQRRVLLLRATCLPGEPCPGVMVVVHDVSEIRRLENLRREFVANVSHELKTPLAAIKAYAETLRMGAVNDPEHNLNFVLRIEEQAERLHELILDMLQIARIESGQQTFNIVDVSLAELIDECLAQFADVAGAKQIDLVGELPNETITARGDEEGLRTILSNLVDNAIKYTTAGGEVQVRCEANGETVTLEVQDSGIGIAERELSRIFERFYRVDRARSREMGGTGLGLSIVKNLTQAFGGTVGVTSVPGQGSTFRVTLRR